MPKYFCWKIKGYYLYFTTKCVSEAMHIHISTNMRKPAAKIWVHQNRTLTIADAGTIPHSRLAWLEKFILQNLDGMIELWNLHSDSGLKQNPDETSENNIVREPMDDYARNSGECGTSSTARNSGECGTSSTARNSGDCGTASTALNPEDCGSHVTALNHEGCGSHVTALNHEGCGSHVTALSHERCDSHVTALNHEGCGSHVTALNHERCGSLVTALSHERCGSLDTALSHKDCRVTLSARNSKSPESEASLPDEAILSSVNNVTSFSFNGTTLRFRCSLLHEKYLKVLEWDNSTGYLEAEVKYKGLAPVAEPIYLDDVLRNLRIDPQQFLLPIKQVVVKYDT